METNGKDRIILALDTGDIAEARQMIGYFAPHVSCFKVGLELLTAAGSYVVVDAVGGRARVMYDGKFDDIPNTVAGASRAVAALGADLFTVHASAGEASVRAAVVNAGASKVIGVTVLTSLGEEECVEIFGDKPAAKVRAFAELLVRAGAQAVVCSPKEVASLVDLPLIRITPGVRPDWAAVGDQKRVMSPYEAILAGADYLVIGRPILYPPDGIEPIEAIRLIAEEVDRALERRAVLRACIAAEEKGGGGC